MYAYNVWDPLTNMYAKIAKEYTFLSEQKWSSSIQGLRTLLLFIFFQKSSFYLRVAVSSSLSVKAKKWAQKMRLRTLLSNLESRMRRRALRKEGVELQRESVGSLLFCSRCGADDGERKRERRRLRRRHKAFKHILFNVRVPLFGPAALGSKLIIGSVFSFLSSSRASIRRRRSMLHINALTLLPSLSYTHRPLMKRRFHSSFILKCAPFARSLCRRLQSIFSSAEMFSRCCKSAPPIIRSWLALTQVTSVPISSTSLILRTRFCHFHADWFARNRTWEWETERDITHCLFTSPFKCVMIIFSQLILPSLRLTGI